MSSCKRFEQEGLAAVQNGEILQSHFSDCPECRAELRRYERVQEALQDTSEDGRLPADWQDEVWQRITAEHSAAGEGAVSSGRGWRFALGGLAAAALAMVLVLPQLHSPTALETELVSNPKMTERAIGAQQGDTWKLIGRVGRSEHVSLRIYLDGRLLAECTAGLTCDREGTRLTTSYVVERLGRYEALVIRSEQPLPSLSGELAADRLAAQVGEVELAAGQAIEIR